MFGTLQKKEKGDEEEDGGGEMTVLCDANGVSSGSILFVF